MSDETIYFGGLPWNLFFGKKPEFANEKGNVLNCHVKLLNDSRFGEVLIDNCFSNYVDEEEPPIHVTTLGITEYFQKNRNQLLPYWYKEQFEWFKQRVPTEKSSHCDYDCGYCEEGCYTTPEKRISFEVLKDFLNEDFKLTDKKKHKLNVQSCIDKLKKIIPEEEISNDEVESYESFFSFFVKQGVLEKIDDTCYRFLKYYTPQEFIYMKRMAYEYGYTTVNPPNNEMQHIIRKKGNLDEFYTNKTWKSVEKEVATGKRKPNFLQEIYKKEKH